MKLVYLKCENLIKIFFKTAKILPLSHRKVAFLNLCVSSAFVWRKITKICKFFIWVVSKMATCLRDQRQWCIGVDIHLVKRCNLNNFLEKQERKTKICGRKRWDWVWECKKKIFDPRILMFANKFFVSVQTKGEMFGIFTHILLGLRRKITKSWQNFFL